MIKLIWAFIKIIVINLFELLVRLFFLTPYGTIILLIRDFKMAIYTYKIGKLKEKQKTYKQQTSEELRALLRNTEVKFWDSWTSGEKFTALFFKDGKLFFHDKRFK